MPFIAVRSMNIHQHRRSAVHVGSPLHTIHLKLIQRHCEVDVGHADHALKLLEAYLAVAVLVCLHDRLIHNLLQLCIFEIASDHHLEHEEQLAVADVPVAVNVVDLERKPQLLLLVALGREGGEPGDELSKVDAAAAVLVEDCNHAVDQSARFQDPLCECGSSLARHTDVRAGWRILVAVRGTRHVQSCRSHPVYVLQLARCHWSNKRACFHSSRPTLSSFINLFLNRSTSSLLTADHPTLVPLASQRERRTNNSCPWQYSRAHWRRRRRRRLQSVRLAHGAAAVVHVT